VRIFHNLTLFTALILLFVTAPAFSKVKVYPIPFVPYGQDTNQGAYGSDDDIIKNTNPQYQINRDNGLIFNQLPGVGTITIYSSTGQEIKTIEYSAAKKNIFNYNDRANMFASGVYIWVVRPSTGQGIEKGKLIILK
jgi:hypothetical protein